MFRMPDLLLQLLKVEFLSQVILKCLSLNKVTFNIWNECGFFSLNDNEGHIENYDKESRCADAA